MDRTARRAEAAGHLGVDPRDPPTLAFGAFPGCHQRSPEGGQALHQAAAVAPRPACLPIVRIAEHLIDQRPARGFVETIEGEPRSGSSLFRQLLTEEPPVDAKTRAAGAREHQLRMGCRGEDGLVELQSGSAFADVRDSGDILVAADDESGRVVRRDRELHPPDHVAHVQKQTEPQDPSSPTTLSNQEGNGEQDDRGQAAGRRMLCDIVDHTHRVTVRAETRTVVSAGESDRNFHSSRLAGVCESSIRVRGSGRWDGRGDGSG